MVSVIRPLTGTRLQLSADDVQWLLDDATAESQARAQLRFEIAALDSMQAVRDLQRRIAQSRIDAFLTSSAPGPIHARALEFWTHVRDVGPLPHP